MEKKSLFFLLAIFMSALQCYSQQDLRPKQWELGVDALSLFNKTHYPAYSIFVAKRIGENGLALRSRIGLEGSSFENLTTLPPLNLYPNPNNNQKRNYFASLGIQKQLRLNSNSLNQSYFYTGLDFGIGLNQELVQTLEAVNNLTDLYFERKETLTDYMLSPFFGYSQSLSKNFSFRVEMAANLIITNYKSRGNGWYIPRYDKQEPFIPPVHENINTYEHGDSRLVSYKLSPLNQIIFTYNF